MAGEPSNMPRTPGLEVDPGQQSLVGALRASFNLLRGLMIVLVIAYLLSGILQVGPGDQGLVARLGKLRTNPANKDSYVFPPGTYFRMLPEPFDRQIKIPGTVRALVCTTFMFHHEQAATAQNLAEILTPKADLTPGTDGAMFTGDKNLSHGQWRVEYQIREADLFVQNVADQIEDFEPLLQRLLETAVVREVAGRTVEDVTRSAISAVAERVQARLQASLDALQTGVAIKQVTARTIEPGQVRDAFLDVTRAENERRRLEDEARSKETETLNRAAGSMYPELLTLIRALGDARARGASADEIAQARAAIDAKLLEAEVAEAGQVAVVLHSARAQSTTNSDEIRKEYEQFQRLLEQYHAQPAFTLLNLWVQMRDVVFNTLANEVIVVPDKSEMEFHIGPDPDRRQKIEEEQTKQRQNRARGVQ